MPLFIFFMLLFVVLGLVWFAAAGLLVGTLFSGIPHVVDRMLDYKGKHCACSYPFHEHR